MREQILEIGRDLAVGQSIMAECPECGVRKLGVVRYNDGLGYHCWRASCSLRPGAVTDVAGPVFRREAARPAFIAEPYEGALAFPTGYAAEMLERADIDDNGGRGVWSGDGDTAVFILQDISGNERGWQERTRSKRVWSGKTKPGPLYGYYPVTTEPPPCVWIVEDPLSAIRLHSRNVEALTILGTRLDVAILDELWDAYPNCRRVYVALDPGAEDAAREAVRLCRMERGLDAIQVPLPDDIHRLDQDTLAKLLEAYP